MSEVSFRIYVVCFWYFDQFCPPNVMMVRGIIMKKDVVVLIDFGASPNFTNHKFIEESKLVQTPTQEFAV